MKDRPSRTILYVRPLHVHHHFDNGQGQDAQLAEIKGLLKQIIKQGVEIMATLTEFETALTRIDTATDEIAADIARLVGQLQTGNLTADQETVVYDKLLAIGTRLEGIGASVENPVPPPTPTP